MEENMEEMADSPRSPLPTIDEASSSPPNNPLHILQCYLSSLPSPDDDNRENSLDQQKIDEVLRVADFLFNNCMEGAVNILDHEPCSITKVVSEASQRSLYLVQGSSQRGKTDSETYLCYVSHDCMEMHSLHHCSCRSFWERSRTAGSATICKHLLALYLLPWLKVKYQDIEVATDEEFAKITLSRLRIQY